MNKLASGIFTFTVALILVAASTAWLRPADSDSSFRLAVFSADVTPPLGHVLFTGQRKEATAVDDPLFARGFAILPPAQAPLVFVSVDWAEIRNEAHDRWRAALAEAAGTTPGRVLVSCVHQHDTPLADLEAQRILERAGSEAQIIDLEFHEHAVQNTATALANGLKKARPITHLGIGEAEIKDIASNRRFLNSDGTPNYGRYSGGVNLAGRMAPEGTIDPILKTLSFWDGTQPVATLSVYATHPMSYYGTGRVSADFPGLARARRQAETPDTFQIYASGASGNVTGGKFNDGPPDCRKVFTERLHEGMAKAWAATERHPLDRLEFHTSQLRLEPRESPGFFQADLEETLAEKADQRKESLAALGLSWRKRAAEGRAIDVPMIDFGIAQLVLLPAEIYVEYQLMAQELRPDSFVVVAGYGECAPGYIPIERAWEEKDQNLDTWCWIAPGAEEKVRRALKELLSGK